MEERGHKAQKWTDVGQPRLAMSLPSGTVRDETLVAYAPEVREALARRGQPVAGWRFPTGQSATLRHDLVIPLAIVRQEAMRIAAGFDHAGFPLKRRDRRRPRGGGPRGRGLRHRLRRSRSTTPCTRPGGGLVSDGEADLAVLACGSGTGVSIVANKLPGVRAVNARDPEDAEMARRHNDANVLALAGRTLGADEARAIVEAFLAAEFEGGRHQRRVDQIAANRERRAPPRPKPAKEAT